MIRILYLVHQDERLPTLNKMVRDIIERGATPDEWWQEVLYKRVVSLLDKSISWGKPMPDLEDIFREFNCAGDEEFAEFLSDLIWKKEYIDHTSMSIGDIVEDVGSGRKWICRSVGWEQIQ